MLTIRKAQMDVFRRVARQNFEGEMRAHLAQFSPSHCQAVGDGRMREVIRFGSGRAEGYGFTLRGPVRLYLELMLLFGGHFDTDPQYPWASEILTTQDRGAQMQRAHRLYEQSLAYRRQADGPADAYMVAALNKMAILARYPQVISAEHFIADMLLQIEYMYPEKAAYVGRDGFATLIREGRDVAQRLSFASATDAVLFVVLMVAFGCGCCADPLYPWIAGTLSDGSIADPAARSAYLERNVVMWLERAAADLDVAAGA